MALSAQQITDRYKSGMAQGAARYTQGVQGVTDNPCALAAARVNDGTWAARTTAAAPKMAARLMATSLDGWKTASATYGASNFAASATKAGAKFARVAQQVAAAGQAAKAAAASLPPGDSVGRFTAAMAAMKAAWGAS